MVYVFSLQVRRQSTVAFGKISYFLREGSSVSLRGSHWESAGSSYDVVDGFLPHFAAFFALRPHGRECSFFSPPGACSQVFCHPN